MGSEQSNNATASLVRRLGRWAGGDNYMAGAYPPAWQERAASAPDTDLERITVAVG